MKLFRTINVAWESLSRSRQKTLTGALKIIEPLKLHGLKLEHAEERIFNARQPRAEAKRLFNLHQRERAKTASPVSGEIDFSDVQELWVKLKRKNHVLYESDGQQRILERMYREISEGTMTKEKFQDLATKAINLKFSRPELDKRALEAELSRYDRLSTLPDDC